MSQRIGEPKRTLEDSLARFLSGRPASSALVKPLQELAALDRAVYQAVAETSTPVLDGHYRRLSRAADKSVLWRASLQRSP